MSPLIHARIKACFADDVRHESVGMERPSLREGDASEEARGSIGPLPSLGINSAAAMPIGGSSSAASSKASSKKRRRPRTIDECIQDTNVDATICKLYPNRKRWLQTYTRAGRQCGEATYPTHILPY